MALDENRELAGTILNGLLKYEVVQYPSQYYTQEELEAAYKRLAFTGDYRNAIPVIYFPLAQNGGGGVCIADSSGTCEMPVQESINVITPCATDVCFLLDGSGSIVISDAWGVEVSVVDGILQSIGNPDAMVSVLEFSTTTTSIIEPTKLSDIQSNEKLRDYSPSGGGTDMEQGIKECQFRLTGSGQGKIVLLTDGEPNDAVMTKAAADAAKSAGITIITVGVGSGAAEGSGATFLKEISSAFPPTSPDAYQPMFFPSPSLDDASNIGIRQVAPALCGVTPVPCTRDSGIPSKPIKKCRSAIGNKKVFVQPCATADIKSTILNCDPFDYIGTYPISGCCDGKRDNFHYLLIDLGNGVRGYLQYTDRYKEISYCHDIHNNDIERNDVNYDTLPVVTSHCPFELGRAQFDRAVPSSRLPHYSYENLMTALAVGGGKLDFTRLSPPVNPRVEWAAFFGQGTHESGSFMLIIEGGCTNTCSPAGGNVLYCCNSGGCAPNTYYCGRGAIQITFSDTYTRFGEYAYNNGDLFLKDPNLIVTKSDKEYAWASGLYYWAKIRQNELNGPTSISCHEAIARAYYGGATRVINGGECKQSFSMNPPNPQQENGGAQYQRAEAFKRIANDYGVRGTILTDSARYYCRGYDEWKNYPL